MEEHLNSAVSCGPLAAAQEMITDGHPARPEHGSQSISHQDFPGAQCDVSKVALTAASWGAHQKLGSQSLVSRLLRWEARFAHQTRANTPSQLYRMDCQKCINEKVDAYLGYDMFLLTLFYCPCGKVRHRSKGTLKFEHLVWKKKLLLSRGICYT